MAGISALALGLPLAAVLVVVLGNRPSRPAEPDPMLAKSLEEASERNLAPPPLEAGDIAPVELTAADTAAETARLERLARGAGGAVMAVPSAEGGVRYWVTVPRKRLAALTEALRSGEASLEFPAPPDGEPGAMFQVVIQPKEAK